MASYVAERIIAVDPGTAYEFRRDFSNLPLYNPDVVDFEPVSGDGVAFTFKLRLGPFRIPVTLRVTEEDPPRRLVCEIDAVMPAVEECTFTPHPDGTAVTFRTEVDSRSGPLRPLVDRVFVIPNGTRQVCRELEMMAALLQDGTAGSGSGSGSGSMSP